MNDSKRRLLLVEDDPSQLEECLRTLALMGYDVVAASSAEEALTCVGVGRFDAILSDNILPGMTGLRAIGEFRKLTDAPVLLMTSDADENAEKDALLLGASAFLRKPLDFDGLRRELSRAAGPDRLQNL